MYSLSERGRSAGGPAGGRPGRAGAGRAWPRATSSSITSSGKYTGGDGGSESEGGSIAGTRGRAIGGGGGANRIGGAECAKAGAAPSPSRPRSTRRGLAAATEAAVPADGGGKFGLRELTLVPSPLEGTASDALTPADRPEPDRRMAIGFERSKGIGCEGGPRDILKLFFQERRKRIEEGDEGEKSKRKRGWRRGGPRERLSRVPFGVRVGWRRARTGLGAMEVEEGGKEKEK